MGRKISATLKITGLIACLFAAYLFRSAMVQPPPVDPAHMFNTERAFARLARILGDETPHPVDSASNDGVIGRLLEEIEALGFTPIVRDEFHCKQSWGRMVCARLQNIAFWVTEPGPNAVLVLSHHDSVPAGPGASDDGAGVAASLEIASIMKSRELSRPLLVLITDGEEIGLMGANLFVEKDPLAKSVGAVVNMEARGVSGLSALIQTSRPNGRDLKTLTSQTRLPAASSLNADIYELLPNDTDMTEFLSLQVDAANLAYAGDVAFYHTPGDNLTNMDQRALFNIGAAGLGATEVFLAQTGEEPEVQHLYVDILGLFILTMPVWLGGVLIVLSGAFSLLVLWRLRKQTTLWRITLIPPAALLAGLGLAMGSSWLVSLIRPEVLFGSAYPIALRGLHASAALTGTIFVYTFLARADEHKALLASGWLCTSLLGLAAFILLPGAAIIFAPSSAFFAFASLMLLLDKQLLTYTFSILGALVFAIITLPLTALGESGLFVEASAPFAIILIFLFIYSAPLIWPAETTRLRSYWIALIGTASISICFLAAAFFVPAYSKAAPRGLSINHIQSLASDEAYWSISGSQPVPEEMNAIAPFETGNIPIFGGPHQLAPAPHFQHETNVNVRTVSVLEDTLTLEVETISPDADRLSIVINSSKRPTSLIFNEQTLSDSSGLRRVICSGRTCRNTVLKVALPADAQNISFDIISTQFGIGLEGQSLIKARPDWAIAKQQGDARSTHIRAAPSQ